MTFRDVIKETEAFGIAKSKAEMVRLGQSVRDVLKARGFKSVAADGFAAPGVVVVYDSEKRESKVRSGRGVSQVVSSPVPNCNRVSRSSPYSPLPPPLSVSSRISTAQPHH